MLCNCAFIMSPSLEVKHLGSNSFYNGDHQFGPQEAFVCMTLLQMVLLCWVSDGRTCKVMAGLVMVWLD